MNAYVCLPLIGSAFIEVRREWVGFGVEHHVRGDRELFLGHLQVTYSPANVGGSRKPLVVAMAAVSLAGLIGVSFVKAGNLLVPASEISDATTNPLSHNNPNLDILHQLD